MDDIDRAIETLEENMLLEAEGRLINGKRYEQQDRQGVAAVPEMQEDDAVLHEHP